MAGRLLDATAFCPRPWHAQRLGSEGFGHAPYTPGAPYRAQILRQTSQPPGATEAGPATPQAAADATRFFALATPRFHADLPSGTPGLPRRGLDCRCPALLGCRGGRRDCRLRPRVPLAPDSAGRSAPPGLPGHHGRCTLRAVLPGGRQGGDGPRLGLGARQTGGGQSGPGRLGPGLGLRLLVGGVRDVTRSDALTRPRHPRWGVAAVSPARVVGAQARPRGLGTLPLRRGVGAGLHRCRGLPATWLPRPVARRRRGRAPLPLGRCCCLGLGCPPSPGRRAPRHAVRSAGPLGRQCLPAPAAPGGSVCRGLRRRRRPHGGQVLAPALPCLLPLSRTHRLGPRRIPLEVRPSGRPRAPGPQARLSRPTHHRHHHVLARLQMARAQIPAGATVRTRRSSHGETGQGAFAGQGDLAARPPPHRRQTATGTPSSPERRVGPPGFVRIRRIDAAELSLWHGIAPEEPPGALGQLRPRALRVLPRALGLPRTRRVLPGLTPPRSPSGCVIEAS
jgi:hypothetical protein